MTSFTLRSYQLEACSRIFNSIQSGKRCIYVNMVVGSGKTVVALESLKRLYLSGTYRKALIVASTKSLVEQFRSISRNWELESNYIDIVTKKAFQSTVFDLSPYQSKESIIVVDDLSGWSEVQLVRTFENTQSFIVGLASVSIPNVSEIFLQVYNGDSFKYTLNEIFAENPFVHSNRYIEEIQTLLSNEHKSGTVSDIILNKINEIRLSTAEICDVLDLLKSGDVSSADFIDLKYRRKQLEEFNKLLTNSNYFEQKADELNGPESVWQTFFETNQWIFGFGLNYLFNSAISKGKLEQVVKGNSVSGSGKRVDALLQTSGLINALCFVEIKTHNTSILKQTQTPYRPGAWAVSDEIAGSIAQIHKTIHASLSNIGDALSLADSDGFKSRTLLYQFKPKAFLIVGDLKQFTNPHGEIQEDQFSSFELFRKSLHDIEVITFDELYARADAIVNKKWNE